MIYKGSKRKGMEKQRALDFCLINIKNHWVVWSKLLNLSVVQIIQTLKWQTYHYQGHFLSVQLPMVLGCEKENKQINKEKNFQKTLKEVKRGWSQYIKKKWDHALFKFYFFFSNHYWKLFSRWKSISGFKSEMYIHMCLCVHLQTFSSPPIWWKC